MGLDPYRRPGFGYGVCPLCKRTYKLRRDGTILQHVGYFGPGPHYFDSGPCEGTRKPPVKWRPR